MRKRTKLAADAWGAVLQVNARLVPILDRSLRLEAGLPLSWYDVLLELSAAPDSRLRMTELAERVVLSRTRVSRVVDEMVAAGLVERRSDEQDRRSAFATITPAGLATFRRAAPIYMRHIEAEFGATVTDAELGALVDILGKVSRR